MPDTEVTYAMVMNVSSSWDELKSIKGYEVRCGELLFTKLFERAPQAKALFGFSAHEDFRLNAKYATHAKAMVDMIDCAVAFLGPDLDSLTEHLMDLGRKHIKYGVQPEYLPIMVEAIVFSLQNVMGPKLSSEDTKNWINIFQLMVVKMCKGMKE